MLLKIKSWKWSLAIAICYHLEYDCKPKSTGSKLTLIKSTDQHDHNKKPMMDHNSEQVHGPKLEPETNGSYNVNYYSEFTKLHTCRL